METISLNTDKPAADLPKIAAALLSGQVVLLPTDTIYGLSCLADNETALRRLMAIKDRPDGKPMISLVSGWSMVEGCAEISPAAKKYLLSVWPGPVTALLPQKHSLSRLVTADSANIALRWPGTEWLAQLIELVGRPIVSTSANLAGQPPVSSVAEVEHSFLGNKPDLLVDGGQLIGQPSRIVDCSDPVAIRILR